MKLEVVVEVSVETILMQQLLLLLFWSLVDGGVIGVGITFCIFTISTNHDKLKKKNYTGHSKSNFISAQIFNCCTRFTTHFHRFDILHSKRKTFLRILQDEEHILILNTTLSEHHTDTSCTFHHNTHFTRNFSTFCELNFHSELLNS